MPRWILLGALLSASCGSPSEQRGPQAPVQTPVPLLQQLAGTEWHCDGPLFRRGHAGQESGPLLAFHDDHRFGYYFRLRKQGEPSAYCISETRGRYRVTDLMTRGGSYLACQEEEWATLEIRRQANGSLEIRNPNEGIEVRCDQVLQRPKLTPEEIQRLRALD